MKKKEAILTKRLSYILNWLNRCKLYHIYVSNFNNLNKNYINNILIYITFLQMRFKYINHNYNSILPFNNCKAIHNRKLLSTFNFRDQINAFSFRKCIKYLSNKNKKTFFLNSVKNLTMPKITRNYANKSRYFFKYNCVKKIYKKKDSYFFYNKLYNLYFYWYLYLNDTYLYFYNRTYFGLWLSFFFLNNKIYFYYLESYSKNILPFFNKILNIFSDYTIFKWFILKKNLYYNINNWFLKKISFNWFFLSRTLHLFRAHFNIFDNFRRSYKLWLIKKSKITSLLLPFYVFKNAKFFYKKGKRFTVPKKKTKFFALLI